MIKLTITEKGGEPRALSFDQNEVSIGRVQGNDIVLPKGNISKRHSKLTLSDGKMVVADVKSTNGTYVNGRKISEATAVRPGDKVFVGDFLIVIDPSGAAAEISSTGSRRSPPPPPPPPPRPGSSARQVVPPLSMSSDAGGLDDSEESAGDAAFGGGPGLGRGKPPAPPPPPPPRRTIATTALQDDGVDIGLDDAPPSPDEVGVGADGVDGVDGAVSDPLAGLAGDVDDQGGLGHDVFGSRAAPDEDALAAGDFGGAAADLGLAARSHAVVEPAEDPVGGVPTPAPAITSGSGRAPGGYAGAAAVGDTHAPSANSLDSLLADPTVTSILITTGGAMQVDRAGRMESVPGVGDGSGIAEAVWQLANTAVPPPASDNPVVDVRLPDGTRVTALFPPVTPGSVCATIRKIGGTDIPLADIAGSGDVEAILRAAVASRRNLLLAGDAPAVATLAAALAAGFPSERRIVSVGTGIKGRPGWIELGLGLDPAGLARAAIAFRADHLVFADSGGAELSELLLAAARGQEGVLACVAARSAAEALLRLRAFAVGAVGPVGFPALITSTIDLIVVAGSTARGGVRVLEIAEPEAQGEAVVPSFVARRPEKNRATTTLDVSGVSSRLGAAIAVSADALPGHLVRR